MWCQGPHQELEGATVPQIVFAHIWPWSTTLAPHWRERRTRWWISSETQLAFLSAVSHPNSQLHLICLLLMVCPYRVASGAGLRRPSVRPSHILFTMWLPMALRTSVSSRGKSSRSRERTRDKWVPRFLWIPEHSMHMRAPRFRLAQVGSWREHKRIRPFENALPAGQFIPHKSLKMLWNYVWMSFMTIWSVISVANNVLPRNFVPTLQEYSAFHIF